MNLDAISTALSLAQFVPTVGKWLFGENKAAAAEKLIEIAKEVTGKPSDKSALATLAQRPELLLEFQKTVMRWERDLEETVALDRRSARERDKAFVESGRKNIRGDVMVVAAALGLVSCLLLLAFFRGKMPGEAVGIISTVAGIFGSCLKDAYAFEFGSSRGSRDKDHHMVLALGK